MHFGHGHQGFTLGPAKGRIAGRAYVVRRAAIRRQRVGPPRLLSVNDRRAGEPEVEKKAVGAWHGSYSGGADLSLARAQRACATGRIRTPAILPKVPGVGAKFPAGCSKRLRLSHCKDGVLFLEKTIGASYYPVFPARFRDDRELGEWRPHRPRPAFATTNPFNRSKLERARRGYAGVAPVGLRCYSVRCQGGLGTRGAELRRRRIRIRRSDCDVQPGRSSRCMTSMRTAFPRH